MGIENYRIVKKGRETFLKRKVELMETIRQYQLKPMNNKFKANIRGKLVVKFSLTPLHWHTLKSGEVKMNQIKKILSKISRKPPERAFGETSPLKPYKQLTALERKAEFESIYSNGVWGKGSGNGSSPEATKSYVQFLENFMSSNNIKSVVDAGCGDWQFSQYIDWSSIDYLGLDTVESVIMANKKFETNQVKFRLFDLVEEEFPPADLLILKDVLQHLSTKSVSIILGKFVDFEHILIVNDSWNSPWLNAEIMDGDYRQLDIRLPPFKVTAQEVFNWNANGDEKTVLHIKN
jgi:SAM-dependent methyltransferase